MGQAKYYRVGSKILDKKNAYVGWLVTKNLNDLIKSKTNVKYFFKSVRLTIY